MKAWLLTSPHPKNDWYEVWRVIGEMKKRGLDAIHINPLQWTIVNSDFFIDDKKLDQPEIIVNRHGVYDVTPLKKIQILTDKGTFIYNKLQPHIDALDKIKSHEKYIMRNIPIPKTEIIDFSNEIAFDIISDKIGWPCVIKWRFSGSAKDVYLCHSPEDVYPILKKYIDVHRGNGPRHEFNYSMGLKSYDEKLELKMIVQEYLDLNYMLRAHAIRKRHIIANMQIYGLSLKGYDKFKGNFSNIGTNNPPDGRIHLPTKPTKELENLVENTLDALDLEWGGVDVFPTKKGLMICEVNPNANIVSAEAAHYKNISGMMIDHILDGYHSNRQ